MPTARQSPRPDIWLAPRAEREIGASATSELAGVSEGF